MSHPITYLSLDFGTSAVKAAVITEEGDILSHAACDYPYLLLPGEKVELSPEKLFDALWSAAARLDETLRSQVEWVCYDTFSPSPVFMKKDGSLAYPNIITHLDRRSREQSDYIDKLLGKDHYMNLSGIYPFPGGCSAMTFIWFLQHMPEVYKETAYIGHLTSYIHKAFTGEWMIDLVNASMTGLYHTITQAGWSPELLDSFGLSESLFPPIHLPGTRLGSLLPGIADKLGVPSGIPVAVGTNDVAAAQMGAKNKLPGDIMNTAGSSEMVGILTDTPRVRPDYYLRNSALPGIWQIYSTTAGGFAVDWFYQQFCTEMSRERFFQTFVPDAIRHYLHDPSVTFDPYLTGDRQSLEKKAAAWHGLTLGTTKAQMFTAMLRSMQMVLKKTLDEAALIQNLNHTIKVSGGMATTAYLELKADCIPGFDFSVMDDCPIRGNMELVKYYIQP